MTNLSRTIKHIKKRRALKLSHHIESLGAAFCRAHNIDPKDAVLCAKDDKYWFETKDPTKLPEHFRELVDISAALVQAVENNDAEGIAVCHQAMTAYFQNLR